MVSQGENNLRSIASFLGSNGHQDPLLFLEEFIVAAKWSNWAVEDRKEEFFVASLNGNAKLWAQTKFLNDPERYKNMAFDEDKENALSLVSPFKQKYLTSKWRERYPEQFENRKQLPNESPMTYFKNKRYLFIRAGDACADITLKMQIRDTMDGVEELLQYAEECDLEPTKFVTYAREEVISLKVVELNHVQNQNGDHRNRSKFIGRVDRRDTDYNGMENDMVSFKERMDNRKRGAKKDVQSRRNYNGHEGQGATSTCYNCGHNGHFAKECNSPCRTCENANHCGGNCPRWSKSYNNTGNQRNLNNVQESSNPQDFLSGPLRD
ncbi:hypothetical protein BD560DRAFT_438297 [Blakeslea trispora]|nr:hypothetical protein BD560DRAFT_438297 [Blakeslea trispora]